jgi:hypothetical protein
VGLSGRVSRTLFTYRAGTCLQAASRTDAVLSAQYYVKAPDIPRDTIDAVASSVYRLARVGGISRLSRIIEIRRTRAIGEHADGTWEIIKAISGE